MKYEIGDLLVCRSGIWYDRYAVIESIHHARAFDNKVDWYKICWLHNNELIEYDESEMIGRFHKIS